jgi:hypothetical protein
MQQDDEQNAFAKDSWSGAVFLWQERGLFLGRASGTSSHAPHAIKICKENFPL